MGGADMTLQQMTPKGYAKAIGVGIATAVILSLVMVPASKAGISPMPKPLGLAFAQVLLGEVPLPVGLLFHIAYVTFWSVVYVAVFKLRTFLNALWLALGLWLLVLAFFFPIVGWGFLGLAVSPKLIVGSLVPHVLFAVILWGISRWAIPASTHDYQENA
jgi:hypothetical protein